MEAPHQESQESNPTTTPETPPARTGNSTRRSSSRNTSTVSSIFSYKKVVVPRIVSNNNRDSSLVILNETRPLSLFYFADKNLSKAIKSLKASRSNSNQPSFARKNEKVHRVQRTLLGLIHFALTLQMLFTSYTWRCPIQ
jgi:hypothetical protein